MMKPLQVPTIDSAYVQSVRRAIGCTSQLCLGLWIPFFILPYVLLAHLAVVAYVPQLQKYAIPVPQTIQDAACAVFPRCAVEAPVLQQEGFKTLADLVRSGHTLLAIYLIASLALLLTNLPKIHQFFSTCFNLVRIRKEQLRQKHASPELRERLTSFAGFGLGAHIFHGLFTTFWIYCLYILWHDRIGTMLHHYDDDVFTALWINIFWAYVFIICIVLFPLKTISYAMWRLKWAG